jgi:hypothetical protein
MPAMASETAGDLSEYQLSPTFILSSDPLEAGSEYGELPAGTAMKIDRLMSQV